MSATARRAVIGTLALAGCIALLLAAWVFGVSEWKMRRHYEAPLLALRTATPPDPAAGEHMAKLLGCWAGCHGDRGEGGHEAIEGIVRNTAPTLSQVLPDYSDAELVRVIRYGVKRDGRSAIGMISYAFWPVGDQDLANVIAHLRRQPAIPPVPRSLELTLRGRLALASGEWKVSAAQVDRSIARWGELPRRNAFERGRYLASLICSECHGLDFNGNALEGAPSLVMVALYAPEDFRRLLHTAQTVRGTFVGPMDWVSNVDFTDREIDDIYTFLRTHHGV